MNPLRTFLSGVPCAESPGLGMRCNHGRVRGSLFEMTRLSVSF
jgi:hypothetical protein